MRRATLVLCLFGAACGSTAAPATPPVADSRFPEPRAPEVECAFEHRVVCQLGLVNDRPFQPPPFEGCPRSIPSDEASSYPQPEAAFSALETRRAPTPGSCCYIAFFTHACD